MPRERHFKDNFNKAQINGRKKYGCAIESDDVSKNKH